MIPRALLAGLEVALNRCLALDPRAQARMGELAGKVIAIELHGLRHTLYLCPRLEGVQVLGEYAGEPDVTLAGSPFALLRLGVTDRGSEALFTRDVLLRGDADLGRRFGAILGELDIDWEEQLSHLTGDVLAHRLGNAVRTGLRWGASAVDKLQRDSAEYVQEELRLAPSRAEAECFMSAVDTLRADTDRLEARIQRLRERLARD